jgi:hypothetical protein
LNLFKRISVMLDPVAGGVAVSESIRLVCRGEQPTFGETQPRFSSCTWAEQPKYEGLLKGSAISIASQSTEIEQPANDRMGRPHTELTQTGA